MALPHPLPDDLVELIARRFRVIGEPMRIKLLDQLREGEATVGELSAALSRLAAERLQAPGRAGRGRHPRPAQAGQPRLLPGRRRGRLRALRRGLRLRAAAAAQPERARQRCERVTVVDTPIRVAAPALEQPETVGPIGRLGRWAADHVRAVAIAWAIVAVALGVFAPKVETRALGRRLAGERLGVGRRRGRSIQRNFAGLSSSALMVVVHSPATHDERRRLPPDGRRRRARSCARTPHVALGRAAAARAPASPPTGTPRS